MVSDNCNSEPGGYLPVGGIISKGFRAISVRDPNILRKDRDRLSKCATSGQGHFQTSGHARR
jgi:hypothetical protein